MYIKKKELKNLFNYLHYKIKDCYKQETEKVMKKFMKGEEKNGYKRSTRI